MIKFRCRSCQKKIGVKDEYAGRAIKCPGCEQRIEIPTPPPAEPAVAEEDSLMPDLADLASLEATTATAPLQSVPAPGRSCPSCNSTLGEHAVICINCGHSLKGKGKKLKTQVGSVGDDSLDEGGGNIGRSIVGLVVASIVAGVFSVLWLVIAAFTGYEFGILAWGLGALVGLVAGVIGRNPSPIYCGIAALLAGGAIIGAKAAVAGVLFFAGFALNVFGSWADFDPEQQRIHNIVMDQMLHDGEITGDQVTVAQDMLNGAFGNYDESLYETESDFDWEEYEKIQDKLTQTVDRRVAAMSPAEIEQATESVRNRHPGWVEDHNVYLAVVDQMVLDGGIDDPGVLAHAKHMIQVSIDGNWQDDDYSQDTSPRQQTERDQSLRIAAVERIRSLNESQQQQAILDAVARHPVWITDQDGWYAVLDQVLQEGSLEGDLAKYAEAEAARTLDQDWDQPFLGKLKPKRYDELRYQLAQEVTPRLLELSDEQREASITQTKNRHPKWGTIFGATDEEIAEMEDALEEIGGADTYMGAFLGTFRWLDFLWIGLAVTSAYSLARNNSD